MSEFTCTICESKFDPEQTGGTRGTIGTFVEVAFCVWCTSGIFSMVEDQQTPCECSKCGHVFKHGEEEEE